MKTFVVVLLALSLIAGCSQTPKGSGEPTTNVAASSPLPAQPAAAPVSASADAIEALRAEGLSLTAAGEIEQPFWTRKAKVYSLPAGDLQLYEFKTANEALAASKEASPTGGTIGMSSMAWMIAPHFYLRGNSIVIYLGVDSSTLETLRTVLGPQFAGR